MLNAGFVTPQNKGIVSRKALFTDKPKTALGDLKKNTLFNVATPIKIGTIEKTKQQQKPFQLSTPIFKPSTIVKETVVSSTLAPKHNVIDYSMHELDVWNQKLCLSDNQFDMIFMDSAAMAPPSPGPPSPLPDHYPDVPDQPDFDIDFDYMRDFKRKAQHDDYELPSINLSPMKGGWY